MMGTSRSWGQLIRYALTSTLTFGLNLGVIWLCVATFAIPYLMAVVVGFGVENTSLYILNRMWTFRGSASTAVGAGYMRSWIVAGSTLALVLAAQWLMVSVFSFDYLVARVLIAPAAYVWSFFADSRFTFKVVGGS